MESHLGPEARTALAMAGSVRAPMAAGLSFVTPEALTAVSRSSDPAVALADACRRLQLDFVFVPAFEPWSRDCAEAVAAAGTAVMWVVGGPLGTVLHERGWTEGLAATATEPETFAPALDDRMLTVLAEVDRGIDAGASVLVVAEDLAASAGPLVPPDFAFDEVFPRLSRVVDLARDADVPSVLHSDGDVRVFLGAVRAAGFSALHAGGGLEFEAFERLFWAARGLSLAVLGGLLTRDLAEGHLSAVGAGTRSGVLAQAGGLLMCDDGGMTTADEMRLYVSALQAARASSGDAEAGA